ncbi:MAG TPA: hypothetical protein VFE37_24910 [Chloroflexota bacterium]|nr:hypothetical protein [Chloroflexota bacterium]
MQRAVIAPMLATALASAALTAGLISLRAPVESQAASLTQGGATPVVRTEAFELVDEAGAVRARLGVARSGSVSLTLLDATGQPRADIGIDSVGSAGISVWDGAGQVRAGIGVPAQGAPTIQILDASGNVAWSAP